MKGRLVSELMGVLQIIFYWAVYMQDKSEKISDFLQIIFYWAVYMQGEKISDLC